MVEKPKYVVKFEILPLKAACDVCRQKFDLHQMPGAVAVGMVVQSDEEVGVFTHYVLCSECAKNPEPIVQAMAEGFRDVNPSFRWD